MSFLSLTCELFINFVVINVCVLSINMDVVRNITDIYVEQNG